MIPENRMIVVMTGEDLSWGVLFFAWRSRSVSVLKLVIRRKTTKAGEQVHELLSLVFGLVHGPDLNCLMGLFELGPYFHFGSCHCCLPHEYL